MTQYLVSLYQPDGPPPASVDLDGVMAALAELNDEMRGAGAFVFTGGLAPSTTATVIRSNGGDVVMTDGPFAEGKEHIGGFWILEAEDLDVAMAWARRAAEATKLPVEVRPFRHLETA
jgi:hypothetical protein